MKEPIDFTDLVILAMVSIWVLTLIWLVFLHLVSSLVKVISEAWFSNYPDCKDNKEEINV